ncbi:MAG: hypothetical protein D3906_13470 [Candidatus Electrothrix sp. AUS1_2]|nr:hypothetical protein [Candidatus Electrothrix sp. AUS1_2]
MDIMVTPLEERMLRAKELEHERIQSEIRRNNAEADRMEAEAKKLEVEANCFKKSKGILSQYIFPGLIGGILIAVCFLDTSKNLYDMTSYKIQENQEIQERISRENEKLKSEKDKLQKERFEFAALVRKRYLEALMRQASAEAYIGWRILKKRDAYLRGTGRNAADGKAQEALAEASQMINDYWQFVVQIAEETRSDMFPEVKQNLADWLRNREKIGGSVEQRKALDLIERHVADVRSGHSQFPDDLIDTFLDQPEFQ